MAANTVHLKQPNLYPFSQNILQSKIVILKSQLLPYLRCMQAGPIGIFDSGYGGLTVLKEITATLPQYDYVYLGDNARAPYGTRSFETIYHYTLECVEQLFDMGCPLIILACNTASARALRTIQQKNLPLIDPDKRVLGIIRPTAEVVGNYTQTNHVGVVGTSGTIASESYVIEIEKMFPQVNVFQEACPMWVPLVENNEINNVGADFFVKQHIDNLLNQSSSIDTILLGCTHYPLLIDRIRKHTPSNVKLLSQGKIVAASLAEYLQRHANMEQHLTKGGSRKFYTTDNPENFDEHGTLFYGAPLHSEHIELKTSI
jgi:glutamate racemase